MTVLGEKPAEPRMVWMQILVQPVISSHLLVDPDAKLIAIWGNDINLAAISAAKSYRDDHPNVGYIRLGLAGFGRIN